MKTIGTIGGAIVGGALTGGAATPFILGAGLGGGIGGSLGGLFQGSTPTGQMGISTPGLHEDIQTMINNLGSNNQDYGNVGYDNGVGYLLYK
jgi:hypothetical protein